MGKSNTLGGGVDSPTVSDDTHSQPNNKPTGLDEDLKTINSSHSAESDETRDPPPVPLPPQDDVDDSDVEEEDVKVCDICGDAGREDLLAVCNRCSDGAEHTYCMREMLDKVPEGEWLCEECKSSELLETQREVQPKRIASNLRSKVLGRTQSLHSNLSLKLDSRDPSSQRNKLKSISLNKQASSKRTGERLEPGSTSKHLALPKSPSPSPSPVAVLSKDSSFKNLDKTKGKPSNQIPTGSESTGESSENALSPSTNSINASKGNFVKSNSFSSSISKQNVKDSEDIAQTQKQVVDLKDGSGKLMGKSMSFKGLGRTSGNEPKVKMLSMKCAPVQEVKGQKHGRERSLFERKNSMKSDHGFSAQTTNNLSKRLSRGADGNSTFSLANSRDFKNVPSDMVTLSKNAGHVAHKSSDSTVNLGELKRPSFSGVVGSSSVNGMANANEVRLNNPSVKDGSIFSYSRTSERLIDADGARVDGQDNPSEKAPDSSLGRSRPGPNSGVPSGNRRGLSSDTSTLKAKERSYEDNKLKAAIEAAMQKKQDIFKKNKVPEKPNDLSMSNAQGNNVGGPVANKDRDSISDQAMRDGDFGIHGSCKPMSVSGSNQFKVYPNDFANASVEESVLTVSAIPEQESVWQGGFEIHRNGKIPDICGGFQAHMSNFASRKVLEVVRKLPQTIVLNEVPRPCAWPVQFKESGAQEDHIALYFFAKDVESYTRSYKILAEYMIKHDLALRGKINGVELLVFPSNHLPHKSQCWNALFFMWGIFRGSRQRCPDDRVGYIGRSDSSVSSTVLVHKDVCTSETLRSHWPVVEDLSVSGGGHTAVSLRETLAIAGSSLQRVASLSNGARQTDEYVTGRSYSNARISSENHEKSRHHYIDVRESCPESRNVALIDLGQQNLNTVVEDQKSVGEIERGKNVADGITLSSQLMLDGQRGSSFPSAVSSLSIKQECESAVLSEDHRRLDVRRNNFDKVELEKSLKQEEQCTYEIQRRGPLKLENDLEHKEGINYMQNNDRAKLKPRGDVGQEVCVDINVSGSCDADNVGSLQCPPERHSQEGSLESVSPAVSMINCLKRPWVDKEGEDTSKGGNQICINKRVKGTASLYDGNLNEHSSFGDRLGVQISGVSCSSHMEDTSNEADIERSTLTDPGSAEGCFFPVNSHVSQSIHTGDGSMPRKVALLENEDRLPDGSPNLELALGVKRKQSREGILPLYAGIVDGKDPIRPLEIASPKEADEDASASLSLSLAFPF